MIIRIKISKYCTGNNGHYIPFASPLPFAFVHNQKNTEDILENFFTAAMKWNKASENVGMSHVSHPHNAKLDA